MTLREYIAHWQETYDKQQSRPTTYAAHDCIFKNHILPGLGDIHLSDLTESMIGAFLEERKRFGSHRPESPDYPGLCENSMRHIHRLLQQCLGQVIQDGLIETNSAKAFRYPKPKKVNANVLTPLEMEDYLDAAERLGYLPKRLKKLVDEIVDEMERLPSVSKCYEQWMILQGKVDAYYHDKPQERIPLSKQKEFIQIKNAVIHEAERLRLDEVTFEERDLGQHDEPEQFRNESYDYWTLRDVIRDESQTLDERNYAVEEMEKLAESGDMYAQYLMGKLWRDGPMLIPDSVNTRYWFERAAEQGHLVAQYSLAKLCLSNDLEVRNIRQGMNWLYTAAANGSHYAMYRLAKECLKGELIEKNTAHAVEWFTKSAERGNQYAQYMLGKLYLTGKEVPHDEERAVYWLAKSADQNNQYAQFLLEHLEENRPPSVMLAETGCSDLDTYNEATGDNLPRLVFACDEVAEMLDKTGADTERKKLLAQIESRLATIARLGRAFGIHLVLATQRPDATIIPGQIKNNLDFRVCGRAESVLSSIILDNGSAAEQIPKDARGRFITGDGTVFQGFLFDDRQL